MAAQDFGMRGRTTASEFISAVYRMLLVLTVVLELRLFLIPAPKMTPVY